MRLSRVSPGGGMEEGEGGIPFLSFSFPFPFPPRPTPVWGKGIRLPVPGERILPPGGRERKGTVSPSLRFVSIDVDRTQGWEQGGHGPIHPSERDPFPKQVPRDVGPFEEGG